MSHVDRPALSAVVEGDVDEAVVRRLVADAGGTVHAVYGRNGKDGIRKNLDAYNQAARGWLWLVVVDLDDDAECAPLLRAEWLPNPAAHMCFRVAVREVEAWLLADRDGLADFLGTASSRIPVWPEAVDDPKQAMVNLAIGSRRRAIREDMAPRPGSRRAVGPAYASRLIEFAQRRWRPGVAANRSESLQRCRTRIQELVRAGAIPPPT